MDEQSRTGKLERSGKTYEEATVEGLAALPLDGVVGSTTFGSVGSPGGLATYGTTLGAWSGDNAGGGGVDSIV